MTHGQLGYMVLGLCAWVTIAPMVMLMIQASGRKPGILAIVLMAPLLTTCRIADNLQSFVVRTFTKDGAEQE